MAIDCCEHILGTLNQLPQTVLVPRSSGDGHLKDPFVNLIVIGVPRYPIRRFFVTQLRRIFPEIPILILRRDQGTPSAPAEIIRGEFLLSDRNDESDCDIVNSLRRIMPFEPCNHISMGRDYELVREVIEVLAKMYPDASLSLAKVAKHINASPKRLSIVLNKNVGVGFRELLRHVRIEEAKRMISTRQYSVKEIAVRVGFTDSHYFSRSFKEMTGQNASEYQEKTAVLS